MTQNHFNFTVEIPDNTLNVFINIKDVALGDININLITFEDFDLKLITELIDEGIKLGLPALNKYLETLKIQIPQKLFNIFTLSNLDLKYHDSYIEAGLTPTFLPPKEDIPGVYKKFVPVDPSELGLGPEDFTTFMYEEIDYDGTYSYHYAEDFSYFAFVYEHLKNLIFDDDQDYFSTLDTDSEDAFII